MKEGDSKSELEIAIRRYERDLVSYAFRLLGHIEGARDCVQEALLRAHQAIQAGAWPENIRAWLYRLTHNVVVDRLRRSRLEDRVRAEIRDTKTAPVQPPFTQELDRLIGRLDSPYREILYLRYAHDLTFPEIESILGTAATTLRVYAARALEMIHRRLKEERRGM